jgi:hypothetical protein
MLLAVDAEKHLVEEQFAAGPSFPLQRVSEQSAEAQAPVAYGFVADHHAARGQDQLNVA